MKLLFDYTRILFLRKMPILLCFNIYIIYSQGGNIDMTFMKTGTGVNGDIRKTLVQPDGKILIAGDFSEYNGISKNHFMRLNSDGSLDTNFNIGNSFNSTVNSIALQSDGKIVVGGQFSSFNGNNVIGLVRLNSDGSLDQTFSPVPSQFVNHPVSFIKVLPNNQILVAMYIGLLKRINSDGSIDTSFNANVGNDGTIFDIKIQNDNKIIIVGEFSSTNNTPRNRIARLNPNGSLDSSFNTEIGGNVTIYAVEILSNNQIVVGGQGIQRGLLYRINTNGTIDTTFASTGAGANGTIRDIEVQENGKIVLVGDFTQYHATNSNSIVRINSDGSFDNTFVSHAQVSQTIRSLAIQPNKRIIIAGAFTNYSDVLVDKIARVYGGCVCE